ncbi:MAG: amidohydrolase [Candidatus Merdivicinus sp.]
MLLIRNGWIKPIESPDLPQGDILIENGKIAAIGTNLNVPDGTEILDASGCLVTPGFVEGHCHIGLHEEIIGAVGLDINETTSPTTPQMRAIDAINPMDEGLAEALKAGVTCAVTGPGSANVVGGTFCAIKMFGKRVDKMIVKDPVAMKIAFGENPKRVYGSKQQSPVTRMATAAILRTLLFKARDYEEKWAAYESGKEEKKPDFDIQLEAMRPVIRREIPLKAHAHRADDIFTALRIAKEFGLDITLDHCTDGALIADELAEENRPVLVGPSLGSKSKVELANKSFETPGILVKAGLLTAIITDAPVIPLQYLPLCAGLAVKDGLPEEEAWKAITLNPARIAGIADRVGSLAVGKDADIAIFRGNPLTDISCRTVAVLVDGIRRV